FTATWRVTAPSSPTCRRPSSLTDAKCWAAGWIRRRRPSRREPVDAPRRARAELGLVVSRTGVVAESALAGATGSERLLDQSIHARLVGGARQAAAVHRVWRRTMAN